MAVTSGKTRSKAATKSTSNSIETTFSFEKETPGTVRYKEDAEKDQQVVGTLYLKKAAAEALGKPESISVVISAD
jgi:hypothetical protein